MRHNVSSLLRLCALVLALCATFLSSSFVTAQPAEARTCKRVTVNSIEASRISAFNLRCRVARELIREWIRQGYFPRYPKPATNWWGCGYPSERPDRRYLCSNGNGGGAPYMLFRTRE